MNGILSGIAMAYLMPFILLFLFQIKHFLADYPLQGKFMLGKFLPGWKFVLPLVAHCAVHAAFTAGIVWLARKISPGIAPENYWLALQDFIVHFIMDRIKAGPQYLGRFKALSGKEYMAALAEYQASDSVSRRAEITKMFRSNVYFWWCLGLDQMVHHLTHYYIIWRILYG
jgi:Protein of unknown function (DUF3307)